MSISEINNILNLSYARQYINVHSANLEKSSQNNGSLFQFNSSSKNNQQNLLLMPHSNSYDDEKSVNEKEQHRLNFLI